MPNNEPLIPQSGRTESIKIADATTKTANPTNKLFAAGPNGSRIERIEAMHAYTYGSSPIRRIVRFHILINGAYYLWRELFLPAGISTSPIANLIGVVVPLNIPGGFNLEPGQEIWVSQSLYSGDGYVTSVTIYAKDY